MPFKDKEKGKEYQKKYQKKYQKIEEIKEHLTEYRKKYRAKRKLQKKIAKEKDPISIIGERIKKSAATRKKEAPHKPLEYRNWYKEQIKLCCYCGNTNETIIKYLSKTGEKINLQQNRLHIERIDSQKGYIFDNMTLACSICNIHKSDIISHEDFKEIAQKYIAPKIKKSLD
tara:strand:- start:3553 stop:4068 length:516 start_codon:yes stop_codon:yes gene_type:complete